MKKEQAQCWQKVSVLEVLFSTAATKSGLPPSTQKNYKCWRWVVSFHWLLSDQECAKSNCFFSSGIQKRVLSWLAMLYIVSAQAVLSGLLHVHTLREERLWWDRIIWKYNAQVGLTPLLPGVMCVCLGNKPFTTHLSFLSSEQIAASSVLN